MIANPRVFPLAAVKLVIGRAFVTRADGEQRAEGVKAVEPPVKAESELVEVGLQVLLADAVMAAVEPAFQVQKDKVNDGQVFFRHGWVTRLNDRQVVKAALGEARAAWRRIGYDHRVRLDGGFYKANQRLGGPIFKDFHPQPPRIPPAALHRLIAFLDMIPREVLVNPCLTEHPSVPDRL